jgi:hypothetical protein
MGKNIRKPSLSGGKKIKAPVEIQIQDFKHPVFCFKYLHKDHNLDKCDPDERRSLIEQVVRLSQLEWQTLTTTHRHGMGSEKIAVTSIKPNLPNFITEDVSFLLAFRFQGLKPIVGHRNKFIFHIIFIDRDFTVYKH